MRDLFYLSETQFNRIKPYFPLSHGVARVDDLRVISVVPTSITRETYPLNLVDRYGGKVLIKVNLKTNDLKQVATQVAKLNKQYQSTRASLRHNPERSPQVFVNRQSSLLLSMD